MNRSRAADARKQPKAKEAEGSEHRTPIDDRLPGIWIGIALLVAVGVFTVLTPAFRFAGAVNLTNIALDASQILILSVATTFVIITAGIDLSIGAILVFSSVIAAWAMGTFSGTPEQVRAFEFPNAGVGITLGVAFALLASAGAGLLNGILIAYLALPPFIVTLGTLGIFTGLALVLAGGRNQVTIPGELTELLGAARLWDVVPVPVIIAIVVAAIGWFILSKTRIGVYAYAIGANREAARVAGINIRRYTIWLYSFSGLSAGIAGIIDVARFRTTSIEAHTTDNLQAISAVVLGGTSLFGGIGHMAGTIIGSVFPSVLKNGFIQLHIQPFWQPVVIGAVLIIAVAYDTRRRARSRQDE